MSVLTDVSANATGPLAEIEVPSLEAFMAMGQGPDDSREFEEIMKGYHDLVDHGRREIYTIES